MRITNTSVTYTCSGCGAEATEDKRPGEAAPQVPEWSDVTVAQRGHNVQSATLCPRCSNDVIIIVTGGRQ